MAEAVNALLDVAYHEAVLPIGNESGDELLHFVGVLVLVDHHFLVFLLEGARCLRWEIGSPLRRKSRGVPIEQKLQGVALAVTEIHVAFLLLPLAVGLGEIQGQPREDRGHGAHGSGLPEPLVFGNRKERCELLIVNFFSSFSSISDVIGVSGVGEIGGAGITKLRGHGL